MLLIALIFTSNSVYSQGLDVSKLQFLFNEEQFQKALDLMNANSNNESNSGLLNAVRGDVFFALGKSDEALLAYQLATNDLTCPFGWVGLGKLQLQKNDQKSALVNFQKAIKINKKNLTTYVSIVNACMQVAPKDSISAYAFLKMGMEVDSKNAQFQILAGDIAANMGDFGMAANDYERAIYYDASNFLAYRKLGLIYTAARNYNQAYQSFTKSIETNPNQILVYNNFGDLYYKFNKYDEAEKMYRHYLSQTTPSLTDIERFAYVLFFTKKFTEASEYLNKLGTASQQQTVWYRIKGYINCETGNTAEGLINMNKFFELHDSTKFIASDYAYFAKLLANDSQDTLAISNYKKAVSLENKNEYIDELAKLYSKNRRHNEAVGCYKQMILNGADCSAMTFNIGKEYYLIADLYREEFSSKPVETKDEIGLLKIKMANNLTLADTCFIRVQELSPSFVFGYIWQGRVQSLLDSESYTTKAKDAYEKALTIINQSNNDKYRKLIVECNKYLGSYYYLNAERAIGVNKTELSNQSIACFKRVLEIDANDKQSQNVLKEMGVNTSN